MTVKFLAAGVAAIAAWGFLPLAADGAAAVGVTSVTAGVQPAVFGIPLPRDPAVDVPSPDQLISVLSALADPAVPAAGKAYLVEGGLGPVESSVMDRRMQKAAANGKFPLSFSVVNIAPVGPDAATADVTAAGPQTGPHTLNIKFVDQGGWKLSRTSLMTLAQLTSS